jgi:phosphomannomutase
MGIDLGKLQNGSDIRGVAIPGVEGEAANLMRSEAEALAKGFAEVLAEKVKASGGVSDCDSDGASSDISPKAANSGLKVAIGCDSRISGPYLKGILLDTLSGLGIDALDCGLASTPAMFMSTQLDRFNCDGAIMVTASHLPYNRNGFKFFDRDGGFQKSDIKEIIEKAKAHYAPANVDSNASDAASQDEAEMLAAVDAFDGSYGGSPALMDAYAAHLRGVIVDGIGMDESWAIGGFGVDDFGGGFDADGGNVLTGLNICIDAGNGAGGFYAEKVLAPLGANVSTSQFLEADGRFPNHVPNPENKEAMASITEKVKKSNVDLGIIFDTDVDRSAAVTGSGREVARNGIVALAAILVSEENPGSTIVTDSITSTQLHEFLEEKLGLKHLRFKRGYKNVINKAIELESQGETCPLAIETSGHAALKENYFLDDGAYLATKIIIKAAQLKAENSNLDDLLADLKEPAEAAEFRMKIKCEDFGPYGDDVLAELEKWVNDGEAKVCGGDTKDGTEESNALSTSLEQPNYEGVRINFFDTTTGAGKPMGWALLRKSLHDPVMPMNIESDKEGGVGKIKEALRPFLDQFTELDLSVLD